VAKLCYSWFKAGNELAHYRHCNLANGALFSQALDVSFCYLETLIIILLKCCTVISMSVWNYYLALVSCSAASMARTLQAFVGKALDFRESDVAADLLRGNKELLGLAGAVQAPKEPDLSLATLAASHHHLASEVGALSRNDVDLADRVTAAVA